MKLNKAHRRWSNGMGRKTRVGQAIMMVGENSSSRMSSCMPGTRVAFTTSQLSLTSNDSTKKTTRVESSKSRAVGGPHSGFRLIGMVRSASVYAEPTDGCWWGLQPFTFRPAQARFLRLADSGATAAFSSFKTLVLSIPFTTST